MSYRTTSSAGARQGALGLPPNLVDRPCGLVNGATSDSMPQDYSYWLATGKIILPIMVKMSPAVFKVLKSGVLASRFIAAIKKRDTRTCKYRW